MDHKMLTKTASDTVKVIADTIHAGIKVEVDHQYQGENNKVAILDMWVWVNSEGKICYEFFRKPMAFKEVVKSTSGLSISTKKQMIFAEGLRRLKCCQPSLAQHHKIQLMDQLSQEMHQA